MITLDHQRHIGTILRGLRHDAGLTLRDVGHRAHVSKSGVSKRETNNGITAGALIDHAQVLGYAVALVPQRHPGARPTGTGWPT